MRDPLDQPTVVRAEASFDVAALAAWLRAREGGLEAAPELLQFGRGFSNLTYLVRFGDRELVVRRAPPGVNIKSAHDMGREFRILSALAPAWPKVPRPVAHCDDPGVIGTPFYVMERVKGVILRAKVPEGVVLDEATLQRVSTSTCDTLAEIHTLDWRAAGLGDLGKPEGYVERQVKGWAERYKKARTDDIPEIERLGAWLEEHRPKETGATLVHNDFKYDNIVLAPDLSRVVAVLDWEMATIGDPLMDLGTALGYWIERDDPPVFQVMVFGPTNRPGNLTRREFVERWSRATGRDATQVLFYYAFALFKLGVVAQQLYKRYVDGFTTEERFAAMIMGVRAVAAGALVAVEKGRIDRLGE
ncbi:MAG TPA: phosphotransferase family protein [Polyangiaceae bacterium]|jgi:aminoglycoside phosphotransferase (APT) family kinase protein|nr:phosphotransferase family protein [Polyangiaceae bacterium]